ncbi:MFS transporter [Burkholderia cenocepacia]|uniref:MFS transporter n=1 Tax=Burkholderia cenocepacia TaxID=95486 RepID=UPI0019033A6B|nr:MFS transporter [Burkholderia cenocepacia]MBJ9698592.1 MFS transporter [Burkholderia cenocepacia]
MSSIKAKRQPIRLNPQWLSTYVTFFISGLGMATWAPLIPFVKTRIGMDDGALGLLLLCLGTGSIMSMPLAGMLASRYGCRITIVMSVSLICFTLPILSTTACVPLLALSLLIFGAGVGSVDVAMNIQAIMVERASGRPMMSGFHALFSLGGITGTTAIMALLWSGISLLAATSIVVTSMIVALVIVASHLLPYGGQGNGIAIAMPRGVVLLIGIHCFIVFLTEGAMLDWSAVFLTSVRGIDASHAGAGYAAFSVTMAAGRLVGDRVVLRVGSSKVIIAGGLCAAGGLILVVHFPTWELMLAGYALVGFGCSNIVPILFTSAGRQTVMPENVAVPAITTLGYGGIVAGPAAIGFISHQTSLSTAFLILASLLLGVAASGRKLHWS